MKQKIIKRIGELKKRARFKRSILTNDPRSIAFVGTAPSTVDGKPSERQLIAFRTPQCTHGKCTMCGFVSEGVLTTTFDDLKAQFEQVELIKTGRASLCTESSFFHPKVPFGFLEFLFEKIAQTGIQEIDLEACAVDIAGNIDKIRGLRALLREDQQLIVGMGLESQDDFVRNELIGKELSKESFEDAIRLLASVEVGVYAYIILKPPGLEEREAIEECIGTLKYFFSVAEQAGAKYSRATLKPLFIPRDTIVEKLFKEGLITPPRLWSLLEVLKRTHTLGKIFVPLTDEGLAEGRLPANCERCTDSVRNAIRIFNATQDIQPLEKISCDCKKEFEGVEVGE